MKKFIVILFTALFVSGFVNFGTAKAAGNDNDEYGSGLIIDGYYSDWDNVPKTDSSHGNSNGKDVHKLAIIISGDYVYIYAGISDLYGSQIPLDDLHIAINGIDRPFIIRAKDANGNINWGQNVYNLSNGIYGDFGIFDGWGGQTVKGDAAVTISDKQPNDQFECRVKIEDMEKFYGLEPGTIKNGAKLEFYCNNIGGNRATIIGTPTGAVLGVALCAGMVLFVRHRRRKEAN